MTPQRILCHFLGHEDVEDLFYGPPEDPFSSRYEPYAQVRCKHCGDLSFASPSDSLRHQELVGRLGAALELVINSSAQAAEALERIRVRFADLLKEA